MTFFNRMMSPFKRRRENALPADLKSASGGNFAGNAYAAVASTRPAVADVWRMVIKWIVLAMGLGLFVLLEFELAQHIIDLQMFLVIVFAAGVFYAVMFTKWPLAAYSLWLVISPLVSIWGFSKPQSVLSLSFDRLALFLPILILTLRLLVDRRKIKMPSIPEWLLLAHAVYIRIPEWLNPSEGGILVAIGFIMAFVGGPICAYFILKSCLTTRKHIIAFTMVLFGMGALWALSGFYEHYTGYRWSSIVVGEDLELGFQDIARGRATGPGQSYPIYGLVLNLSFALAALYYGFAKNKSFKFLCFVSLPFILVGLFFGYSKGAYISFALLTLMMLAMARQTKKTYAGIALAAAIVVMAGYGAVMSDPDFSARMDFRGSLAGRTAMHLTAIKMFYANPIFGVGYGNFSDPELVRKYMVGSGHYRQLARSGLVKSYSRPHSEYLAVLAEQGLVGFLLYYGAVFLIMVKLVKLRAILKDKDLFLHDLCSLLMTFIVCVLLVNLNDEFYKYPYMYFIIYSVFAIAARISELAAANKIGSEDQLVPSVDGRA